MKAILFSLLGVLSLMSPTKVVAEEMYATPEADAAAYTCDLRGAISGVRLGFFIDGQILGGDATIHCTDAVHHRLRDVNMPVRVRVIGGGVGFDFTIVQRVNLRTAGIGAIRNPRDLLGQYNVAASAGLDLINRGISVQSAISVKHRAHGLAFEVGFQGEKAIGLGARLNGLIFLVEPR
jgi:hypothetical protein